MVAQKKADKDQLAQNEDFTLHYFGLYGAQTTAVACLEQCDIPYKSVVYTFDTWGAAKPKMPTGVVPVIEYSDGTMIPESGSIQRVCAARGGLLCEGRDFALSEMLVGMNADLWDHVKGNVPTIMTVGSWPVEKTDAWENTFKPKVKEQLQKYCVFLKDDSFFTACGVSIGEMELWVRLFMLINGAYATVLSDVPALKPFYDRMCTEQGPKRLINNETKVGPLGHYFVPLP